MPTVEIQPATQVVSGKVSVIMPAFNESEHIQHAIRETVKVMTNICGEFEIIIIDDHSTDATYHLAEELAQASSNIFIERNRSCAGKGWALKQGFLCSTGDYIAFLDSDLEIHPEQLRVFIDIMNREKADVVIGSKRHKDSKLEYPWHRRILSSIYFFLVKILFGLPIHDTQTGLKLFKREVLEKAFPKMAVKQFVYDLELLALAHHYGFKIAEAPVVVHSNRKFGSRIGLKCIYRMWWDTMALWYRLKLRKLYTNPHA